MKPYIYAVSSNKVAGEDMVKVQFDATDLIAGVIAVHDEETGELHVAGKDLLDFVSAEELIAEAKKNTAKKAVLYSLEELKALRKNNILGDWPSASACDHFTLQAVHDDGNENAGVIFCNDVLDLVGETLGEGFYILPVSQGFVVIVRGSSVKNPAVLNDTLAEMQAPLPKLDRLSPYTLYYPYRGGRR